jgi:class 3 adenylate cyclase
VTRTLSAEDVAAEAGTTREAVEWMTRIGALRPAGPDAYRVGDVFRAELIGALAAGFDRATVEDAVARGSLNLEHVDRYLPLDPGPKSGRPFAEFCRDLGALGAAVPLLYEVLGLPEPNPSSPIGIDEEELFERFLEGWGIAADEETLARAARLMAEGARTITLGWSQLLDERVAGPARERLLRGEVDRFPEAATRAISTLVHLAPRMFEWLSWRYRERESVEGIVEGFEQFLASRGLAPPPRPAAPPAVVFVDLSGFTRATEERGDEAAVHLAITLQREADAAAAWNGGRLVKLLGDGAMLRFPDARHGVAAALSLVRTLSAGGRAPAHAGVHAGPVVERDMDLFGRTVNVAARVADAADPGEVLVTDDVVRAADDPAWAFEPAGERTMKGLTEPIRLFRVEPVARA